MNRNGSTVNGWIVAAMVAAFTADAVAVLHGAFRVFPFASIVGDWARSYFVMLPVIAGSILAIFVWSWCRGYSATTHASLFCLFHALFCVINMPGLLRYGDGMAFDVSLWFFGSVVWGMGSVVLLIAAIRKYHRKVSGVGYESSASSSGESE